MSHQGGVQHVSRVPQHLTYLNNEKLDGLMELHDNDLIRVGEQNLLFRNNVVTYEGGPFADKVCKLEEINIRKDFPIGRYRKNAIVLDPNDRLASRHHATIIYNDGEYYLEDIGSLNRTYLNNKLITGTVKLNDNDKIILGETKIKFKME